MVFTVYDLSCKFGVDCLPWPTMEPLEMKFFKRLAPNGANGQILTHSNHVGTHLDGPIHFDTAGRDMASLELTKLLARYGKTLAELYPWPDHYQAMHIELFKQPYEAIHAECLGGDIDKLSNKRCVIGAFPWKLVGGEACVTRIVAFDGFEDA